MDELTTTQRDRYARQIGLPQVGEVGQQRLQSKRVLLVGVGGLGCPIATYLVAAGVGRLTLVDADVVSVSNLQRQTLYRETDIGLPKAEIAARRLRALNGDVEIDVHAVRFDATNALTLAQDYDLLVDGTDNFDTRYVLDDAAARLGIPYLYGAVEGFVGQCSLFHHDGAGSYRQLFPAEEAPMLTAEGKVSTKADVAVAAPIPGIIGATMAAEALKLLLDIPTSLSRHLYCFDALTFTTHLLRKW